MSASRSRPLRFKFRRSWVLVFTFIWFCCCKLITCRALSVMSLKHGRIKSKMGKNSRLSCVHALRFKNRRLTWRQITFHATQWSRFHLMWNYILQKTRFVWKSKSRFAHYLGSLIKNNNRRHWGRIIIQFQPEYEDASATESPSISASESDTGYGSNYTVVDNLLASDNATKAERDLPPQTRKSWR